MNLKKYQIRLKEEVIDELVSYREEDLECGYTKGHINKCKRSILKYLKKLNKIKVPSEELIMSEVKRVVIALNKLNEKTEYCLIETDARDAIWEIIQESAIECGIDIEVEDVTEEWREW